MWFKIHPLQGLICLKGTRGISIWYNGYIEANLLIPGLHHYNKDVLFLIILNNKYGERVPGQWGTLVIDNVVATMTTEELQ